IGLTKTFASEQPAKGDRQNYVPHTPEHPVDGGRGYSKSHIQMNSETNLGNWQLSQRALDLSQKSRTIWTSPCCNAAVRKTPRLAPPIKRLRAIRRRELSSAGGQTKYRCSILL